VIVLGPRVALLACLLALAVAGCATGEREDDAAAVSERFHAALDDGDGAAACNLLAEETASALEQQEGDPCEEAILSLELPTGGTVAYRRVEMTSAETRLAEGSSDFLDEGPDGWRIAAAGCVPTTPEQPYECELEG
jgi:hypothetical protein